MSRFSGPEIGNGGLKPVGPFWQHSLVSLEVALKPVMDRFDEMDRSIRHAKRHCHYPSDHGLTQDESAAIYLYTMDAGDNSLYRVLNEILRSPNRQAAKVWFGYLKLFDTAVNKLPSVKKAVWRGMDGDFSHLLKKDEVLTWWGITSCSTSVQITQQFMGSKKEDTLLMIMAKNAKDITNYSAFSDEKELILKSGTYLRVEDNAFRHAGGLTVVHLVELDDDEIDREKEKIKSILPSEAVNKVATGTRPSRTTSDAVSTFLQKTSDISSIQPSITESTSSAHRIPNIILES